MSPPKKSSAPSKKPETPPPPPSKGKGPRGGTSSGSGNPPLTPEQLAREAAQAQARATRELIAGPSWTGKLPVNLLHEHCQKAGWEKPEYSTPRTPLGFTFIVTLKCRNKKTNALEEIEIRPPKELSVPASGDKKEEQGERMRMPYEPTALEAKHLGATYALHRVSNMKNVGFMLPPRYRAWWGVFEEVRKVEVKSGAGWMYEADPFLVARERQAAVEKAQKEREAREAAAAAAGNATGGIIVGGGWNKRAEERKMLMKGWQSAPVAEMAKDVRQLVEDIIRRYHVWNPMGIVMSQEVKRRAVEEFVELGFRRSHAEEGCDWAGDREECLEWLLVHVPEDDLPPRFLPDKYTVGVSITGGNIVLSQEYAAKRLSATGYSLELCRQALQLHNGNEALAAEYLMHRLLATTASEGTIAPIVEHDLLHFEEGDPWEDEQVMLGSIWGNTSENPGEEGSKDEPRYKRISEDVSHVLLDPEIPPMTIPKSEQVQIPEKMYLQAQKPIANYPTSIPIISIITPPPTPQNSNKLPAHVKLSIIRQAAQYALNTLRGEQMVFAIADWLNANIINIINHPGRLRDVASAVTQLEPPPSVNSPLERKATKMAMQVEPVTDWTKATSEGIRLYNAWAEKYTSPSHSLQKLLTSRKGLPAWKKRNDIVSAIMGSPVTIITGETGSGKSTQAVQFILDHLMDNRMGDKVNIICTQPRRISALGLADRVAEERGEKVGGEVGYVIRGESRSRKGVTKITFVTTGVLLRRMQMSGNGTDGTGDGEGESRHGGDWVGLEGVSHVFVDEVHERSLDTDFLLVLLKRALQVKKDLKVVLMSATVDADTFVEYFGGEGVVSKIEIEGRTFPVDEFYLDDVIKKTEFEILPGVTTIKSPQPDSLTPSNSSTDLSIQSMDPYIGATIRAIGDRINYALIAQLVRTIDVDLTREATLTPSSSPGGGILIFLPGTLEIQRTIDAISRLPSSAHRFHVLPLHASLPSSAQKLVFPPPPRGKRKVIVATNVAETSITIEDIVAVIDTGRVKETSYDPASDIVRLTETWASKAACKQRKGRAGRVRRGKCYKLFTRSLEAGGKMLERLEPELKRVPLQQTCLGVKAMGIRDVRGFLSSAVTPPETGAVDSAMHILAKIGALKDEELTSLGRYMAMIPADLKCSKLLVYATIFGCLDICLTIAAVLSTKPPFFAPPDKREEAKSARMKFADPQGDVLCDALAHQEWIKLRKTMSTRDVKIWCETNFLNYHALMDISSTKAQLLASLKEAGLVPWEYTDLTSSQADEENLLCDGDPETQASQILLRKHLMELNSQDLNYPLIRALIAAAFTPHLARIQFPDKRFTQVASGTVEIDPEARQIKFFTIGGFGNVRVFIHPSSTLFDATGFINGANFLSYFSKMATGAAAAAGDGGGDAQEGGTGRKTYIRDITPVGTYSLLLLGGELGVDTHGRGMTVDGWLRVRGWGRVGVLVGMLRKLLDGVVSARIEFPRGRERWEKGDEELGESQAQKEREEDIEKMEREVVEVVRRLVENEGH